MGKEKRRVGIFIESDFFENEIFYYQLRFAEENIDLRFYSRLWGQDALTFKGHEFGAPFECRNDFQTLEEAEVDTFSAFIVPAGMVADRLRYTEDTTRVPPACLFLKKLFEKKHILKGIICHGLWLASPVAEVVRGRKMVAHNNLIGDVKNYGAVYVDQDLVVDDDLISARTGLHCNLLAKAIIERIKGDS